MEAAEELKPDGCGSINCRNFAELLIEMSHISPASSELERHTHMHTETETERHMCSPHSGLAAMKLICCSQTLLVSVCCHNC